MSLATQNQFIASVEHNYELFALSSKFEKPSFSIQGFLTSARIVSAGGTIEILCGPPEYHAEIFIECAGNPKRWGLADLIQFESVRCWLESYKSNTENQTEVEADVEWLFRLLSEGLKGIKEFDWIQS